MNKLGYTVIDLVITIGVFSVVYFAVSIAISGNFKGNYENKLYEEKLSAIESQATIYAKINETMFKDDDTVYLTVEDLALKNAIVSSKEGVVVDPRDSEKTLNNLKVKIINKDGEVSAKVLV